MSSDYPNPAASGRVPKFDMRLGPDTDGSALALYRQNIELLYRLEISGPAAANFASHAVTYQLPRAVLASVASVAQALSRGPAEIARGGDQFVLYLQLTGDLDATYGGQRRKIGPGDVVIIDYGREIVSRASDFEIIYLLVPRDRVPSQFLAPAAHGAVFTAVSGRGQLLSRSIETLFQTMDRLTLGEAEAAVDAMLTLAAGALEGWMAEQLGSIGSEGTMIENALAFIDRNLANAQLSPTLVEANLPLSRSALYRLFEPHGGVRNVILQRRLERSMRALLVGDASKPALRTIARNHGFSSEEQFSRAFRKRFGLAPYQFHDLVRRNDRDGLAALARRAGFSNLRAWIEEIGGPAAPALSSPHC
jgi:AraC-like DNA-binding protein